MPRLTNLITLVFFTSMSLNGQASLKKLQAKLDAHPQKDSLRCVYLNQYIDAQNDDLIWPAYNEELSYIAKSKLKQKNLSKTQFLFFTEMECLSENNKAYILGNEGKYEAALTVILKALE